MPNCGQNCPGASEEQHWTPGCSSPLPIWTPPWLKCPITRWSLGRKERDYRVCPRKWKVYNSNVSSFLGTLLLRKSITPTKIFPTFWLTYPNWWDDYLVLFVLRSVSSPEGDLFFFFFFVLCQENHKKNADLWRLHIMLNHHFKLK